MPHSILMMHHPSGASRGQASEMHIESRELVRVRDYLSLIISDSTGQPYDRVRGIGVEILFVIERHLLSGWRLYATYLGVCSE